MEKLTFINFQDSVSKTILNKAKKLLARDLEEESPNKFVAYVDEGKESYDVAIEFDNQEIKKISCDCDNGTTLCCHKITLINHIKSDKQTKTSSLKKKQSESDILVHELDAVLLRSWVSDLFKKNKDIELLFISEFTKSELIFSQNEVKTIIEKAIKSVIKNKRTIDATELKRIVEVLEVSFKPIVKFCQDKIALPETNELLLFAYGELLEFNYLMDISSVKLIRFVEKIYKEMNLYIHNNKDNEQWELVVRENIEFLFLRKNRYELELETIFHLYESIESKKRKDFFAKVLFDIVTVSINKGLRYSKLINHFLLKVFSENELFEKLYFHFQPIRYENDYNTFLLEKLLDIQKYDLAEKMAMEQINSNSNEKYNVTYYNLLSKIYAITNDAKKIALLKMKTIFYEYSLDSYLLIEKHCEENEFKKFRTKFLTHLKRNFYGSQVAVKVYFEIFNYNKKYKNMIDNISEYTSYELIYDYREVLYQCDKIQFLKGLTKIESNSYFYFKKQKENTEFREKFLQWIKEKYDRTIINAFIKSETHYYRSELMKELEINLKVV